MNGEAGPPPVDVEGVTGVNINGDDLAPVVWFVAVVVFVVPEATGRLKENAGLSMAEGGFDAVVVAAGNALTGVVVAPNTLPFLSGLGPGL